MFTFQYGRLKTEGQKNRNQGRVVYIPIWTIKDLDKADREWYRSNVYIPIWTIKDDACTVAAICKILFTFQYGRLKTRLQSNHTDAVKFTFQYGRLKTARCARCRVLAVAFTFQYGRLKTVGDQAGQAHALEVYIPIWTIKDYAQNAPAQYGFVRLHSNMDD